MTVLLKTNIVHKFQHRNIYSAYFLKTLFEVKTSFPKEIAFSGLILTQVLNDVMK